MTTSPTAITVAPTFSMIDLCERGFIPDALARRGMRSLMRQRLLDESIESTEGIVERRNHLLAELRASPIAIDTSAANEQHYEVPAEFFHLHLGPRLKYSSCLYRTGNESLGEAEEAMLELYAQRAELFDGLKILDLGCGWGSLSLWLAEKFPNARITGLSNSNGQREFIEARARARGLSNLSIVTGNIVDFEFPPEEAGFDRVISIEMFEHMKNYGLLLKKIAHWTAPGGKLFVHIFVHRLLTYHFDVKDSSDWMTKYFFTGGIMPSTALLAHFQDDFRLRQDWWVSGTHYERTANQWLAGMDRAKAPIMAVLEKAYGAADAKLWFQRWRMFYMAVAELFGYAHGNEWGVNHYLFEKR